MNNQRKYLSFLLLMTISMFTYAQQELKIGLEEIYQTIDGFGASDAWRAQFVGKNWPIEKREQIADLLFSSETDEKGNPKGIGLSVWRYYIGSGSTELGDSAGIANEWRRSESFLSADGTYDWSKNEGQDWFLHAAKDRGVEKFLGFSIAAPVFMAINGRGYSIKEDPRMNIKPGKLDDYAAYLVEVLKHYEEEGIIFDYLSPFNEPQWDWSKASQEGTAATNEDIYLFVNYLSNLLEQTDLNTKLLVGEAAMYQFLYEEHGEEARGDQIDHFFNPESPLYIGDLPHMSQYITGHSYFTSWPPESQYKVREDLKAKLDEYPGLGFLQTEYCILESSPEIGSGHKRGLGMNTALFVARLIHSDITIAQSEGWQWWTALSQFDYKDGLIYLDTGDEEDLFNIDKMKSDGEIRESKLLWALGNYSRFVRPGMVRVVAELPQQGDSLQVSAYKGNSEVVMVFNNHQAEPLEIQLPDQLKAEKMYVTDKERNLALTKVGRKGVKLPARSVVTVIATTK